MSSETYINAELYLSISVLSLRICLLLSTDAKLYSTTGLLNPILSVSFIHYNVRVCVYTEYRLHFCDEELVLVVSHARNLKTAHVIKTKFACLCVYITEQFGVTGSTWFEFP
jgi:hypothetical protein